MKLLEYKGKELLKKSGLDVPKSILVNNKGYSNLSYGKERYHEFFNAHGAAVIKAQVIGGGRGKGGFVFMADNYEKSLAQIDELYSKKYNGHDIDTLLIEEKLDIEKEYFLSISYDTKTRRPMIMFSQEGGVDIENATDTVKTFYPEHVSALTQKEALEIFDNESLSLASATSSWDFIVKAYACFMAYDCSHLEINPIILTKDGKLYAADAKITIDDGAVPRQEELVDFVEMGDKASFSELEIAARKIDQDDHRGVAGKTFVELDGDIAVLASGGGASLTSMDALIEAGGAPANYTEYSGNPSSDKVQKLTEVTLSKKGLNGCLVIGGTANFTDIFDTLSGFVRGLENLSELPKYPIVVRRAGPRDKEAFEMLKKFGQENNLDLTLFGEETQMSYAAKIMAEKVKEYKRK